MRSQAKHFHMFLVALLVCGALSMRTQAQTTRGTITGAVADESGAVVVGAKITVTQIDTGFTHTTTTDSTGNYVVPSLFPGRYKVEAELQGFQKTVVEPLQLHVDERLAVNLTLKVGTLTQEVVVTSQGELVQTASASIGQVVGSKMVTDLPLNGRNFLQLGLLSPGTTTVPPGGDTAAFGEPSLNVSGGREASNQFSIDGVYNNAIHMNGMNLVLSVDAVQEFKMQRNTFSAEFGTGTAQVNVASKAGSNDFHGSLYEFVRNDALDARQFFDADIPAFRQNQFGAAVGGRLRKDSTFFFANYEGFRLRREITIIGTLPTAQLLSGDFTGLPPVIDPLTRAPFENNQIPPDRFSDLTQRILPLLPRLTTGGANNFKTSPKFTQDWNQVTIRLDHRISSKDFLFARYSFDTNLDAYSPGLIPQSGSTIKDAPRNAAFQWTHSFSPTALNELRFGFNRNYQQRLQDGAYGSDLLQFQNINPNPANRGLPFVNIPGFSAFGTSLVMPEFVGGNTYQYDDNMTWIRGRHTLKFGGAFRNVQFPHTGFIFGRGFFIFQGFASGNPVADFLLGNPFIAFGGGAGFLAYMSFHQYQGYLQDDWKVAPRLTLNFGIRYERTGAVKDRYLDRLPAFDEVSGQLVPPQDIESMGLVNPDNNDFGPRFGFSWQPFSQPHTVIRGGYGVYNDVKPFNERNFSLGALATWTQLVDIFPLLGLPPSVSWDNLFPAGGPAGSLGILTDDPRSRNPYVQQWSFGFQRELPFDTVLEATYMGSTGRKLSTRIDINQASLPTVPGEPLAPRRPYPTQGNIFMSKNLATSNYNALQVRVEKRFSHNLNFLASYTFSKSLDTASSTCDVSSCNSPQNIHNLRAEYGLSSFDERNRFVLSSGYLFPFGSGQRFASSLPKAADVLVKGWQVNSIITFASGKPFPIQVAGVDRTQTGVFGGGIQRANCIGPNHGNLPDSERTVDRDFDTNAFEAAAIGTFGSCGRDIVFSRGVNNWDISIFKNTSLSERTTLQFRTEFFNTWNHPQFHMPNFDPTSLAFGQITAVRPAREIQFALKLLF